MFQILLKSGSFIFLIILGYFRKCKGFFGPQDYKILTKIVLNVTMPCAVLVNFSSYKADLSLLLVIAIGFGMNCLMLTIAYLISRKYPRRTRAVILNCLPSYNIGCFTMPFVQSFLSPASLVGTCLFDAGNALMCNGTTFALSQNILDGTKGLDLKRIGKTLLTSVPFMSYAILLILSLIGVTYPQALVNFVTPMANSNAFLAMFMVGMMLDFNIEKSLLKQIFRILIIRFSAAVVASAAFFFLLPLPLPIRQALSVTVFAPIGMVSTALSATAGGDPAVAAGANSISILICIPSVLIMLAILGVL